MGCTVHNIPLSYILWGGLWRLYEGWLRYMKECNEFLCHPIIFCLHCPVLCLVIVIGDCIIWILYVSDVLTCVLMDLDTCGWTSLTPVPVIHSQWCDILNDILNWKYSPIPYICAHNYMVYCIILYCTNVLSDQPWIDSYQWSSFHAPLMM